MLVQINLLPVELRRKIKTEKKTTLRVPRFVPFVVVGAVAFAIVITFMVMAYTGSVKSNLKQAKKMLKEEKIRSAQAITYKAEMPEIEERAECLVSRVDGKIIWWEILDQVSRSCPSSAVLKKIEFKNATDISKPPMLVVTGYYEEGDGLEITFTDNLQLNPKLNKYVDKINREKGPGEGGRTEFTVKCIFKQPEKKEEPEEET